MKCPLMTQSGHCPASTRPLPTSGFDGLRCHSPDWEGSRAARTAAQRRCNSAVEIGVCSRSESCSIVIPLRFPLVPAKAGTRLDSRFRGNEWAPAARQIDEIAHRFHRCEYLGIDAVSCGGCHYHRTSGRVLRCLRRSRPAHDRGKPGALSKSAFRCQNLGDLADAEYADRLVM